MGTTSDLTMFALIHQLFNSGLQKLHSMVGKHLTWGNQASNYQLGYGPHWNQHRTRAPPPRAPTWLRPACTAPARSTPPPPKAVLLPSKWSACFELSPTLVDPSRCLSLTES